jgi:hypothetical protein
LTFTSPEGVILHLHGRCARPERNFQEGKWRLEPYLVRLSAIYLLTCGFVRMASVFKAGCRSWQKYFALKTKMIFGLPWKTASFIWDF